MKFIEIDMEQWASKEHYRNNACSYSLTIDVDVSDLLATLKAKELKVYPVQIYMLSTVVSQFAEFRMSTNEQNFLADESLSSDQIHMQMSSKAIGKMYSFQSFPCR